MLPSEGQVVLDHRRLPADREPLQSLLRELEGPVTVTVEATLPWAWRHDRLTQAGFPVRVAHPQQVKLISHARCKTDPIDARKLAELTRATLLPTIWVPPPEVRAWRQLVRSRASLVRLRTRAKNRIHGCLAEANLRVPTTDLVGRGGRTGLITVAPSLPPTVRRESQVQLARITALDQQIIGFDGEVQRLAARQPTARLLQTIPGIGPFGALLLLAEIGTITRFQSGRALAAYAGLVPSTRSSGGKTAHGSVARAGSGWLKWILIEAVQTLKQVPGPVRCHYERLLRAKGQPKATVAAARKLSTYIYWMLRHERSYPEWLHEDTRRAGCPVPGVASSA